MDSSLNARTANPSRTSGSSSVGANAAPRAAWVKPAIVVEEISRARTGGSNFLNLDGGSTCAS